MRIDLYASIYGMSGKARSLILISLSTYKAVKALCKARNEISISLSLKQKRLQKFGP
jgi:hypothetical protein